MASYPIQIDTTVKDAPLQKAIYTATGVDAAILKREDFTLLEDGKKQAISTFDFENVDEVIPAGAAEATVSGTAANPGLLRSTDQSAALNARDRRLMLLFFDFSGMEPEDIERSVNAAKKFVQTRMQPADMIAMVLGDHHIAQRFFRHRLDVFQKSAGIRIVIAGIHQDDAFGRHDHHGVGVVLLADIGKDAIGELLEFRNIAGDGACVQGPSDRGGKRKNSELQLHGVPRSCTL